MEEIYKNHAEMPYIAPKYEKELLHKPIPKRNMERTGEELLPGHIILLWRIQFGTYTNQSSPHKYFYTTYGIDPVKELDFLIKEQYVQMDGAFESVKHLPARQVKEFLQEKGLKGLSKYKRSDLDDLLEKEYCEIELASCFELRGYSLLPKGEKVLSKHPEIVAKRPQKSF